MKAAIYARVSTTDQEPENQLAELRDYCAKRGWEIREYVDAGVSGAKERRPALDQLLKDARRRRFGAVVCWRLDRAGRSVKHLVLLIDELQTLGIAFVSLAEGIDATTTAGKLQLHVLAAIAEFERGRLQERVKAGLARARAEGRKLGRPRREVPESRLAPVRGLSAAAAAKRLGVSRATAHRWLSQNPPSTVSR